jgi:hypothetical protein
MDDNTTLCIGLNPERGSIYLTMGHKKTPQLCEVLNFFISYLSNFLIINKREETG